MTAGRARDRAVDGAVDGDGDLDALLRELVSAAQLFQAAAGVRARLTPTELAVLTILRSSPRLAGQLSAATRLTTGAITKVLDGLERRGFLTRAPDPGDRRRVIVTAVAERVAALDVLLGPMTDAAATIQSTFSPADQRTIARFLAATTEMLRDQTQSLRDGPGTTASPVTQGAPLGVASRARLRLTGGVSHLVIVGGGDDLPGDSLYQGTFPGGGPTSKVLVRPDETEVRIQFGRNRSLWRAGGRASTLTLSPRVPWTIDIGGGADHLVVDAAGLALVSASLTGGANNLRLRLGSPRPSARISITGGVKALRVERPAGVPVDLRLRGGASQVVVDGRRLGPQGTWSQPGALGKDRYELAVTGGVKHLEIAPLS
ncbi:MULTISPECIES: MarR family winged helix-turn-helix transcriptional regulator [unclassified Pseudofrankia]|uniref:MarR family winged helix-turn-helix transcriptional regulator n=1 Tax=unclassified Pseudofrankia TaxID=2994372 RepID=UPI0008DA7241|nr:MULTISPECIES: MarR family transcriptional regulator [unclassified Pseudofrankia]MDT3445916.1 MarR family transcriptional regulator [Pseudofrankia sp. BMG5.37]OHV51360.1 MarR family transcriptional regulator [Pseudofrankia sp. BMG5.36]